ncbi:hypothetical protein T4D_2766 [Trichinella pseudospiralis]|uniref:Uncharacterized protein n=1 Tax=Trichinella pseudospiralis TaxID=6337 RepID=A0A0V1FLU8_TRIPS|nr:hypothetical protein T4D_2766 [Trichinella pseudospiralis]
MMSTVQPDAALLRASFVYINDKNAANHNDYNGKSGHFNSISVTIFTLLPLYGNLLLLCEYHH